MRPLFLSFSFKALLFACVSAIVTAQATPITLYVDSSRSSLALSGAAFGLPFQVQSGHAGSLLDAWSGTIQADLSGGVLTFSSGSAISALLNTPALPPFSTTPYPDVPAGSVDNYGAFGSGLVTGVGLVLGFNGAYRSLTLDITSGTASQGASATGLTFGFTSGHVEWGAIVSPSTPYGGSSSLIGVAGTNTSALQIAWDGQTLSLPMTFRTIGSNRYEDWSGTMVAVVPEPSSLALALVGVSLLAMRKWARQMR